jgi:flagellar basal body-associated protein FliL
MADLSSVDLILGIVIVAVAAVVILMFWRASGNDKKKKEEEKPVEAPLKEEDPLRVELQMTERKVKVPGLEKKIATNDVERAKSQIRTLTLKQEINSMVLRRLFEAEDEGEISREERVRLGKVYEDEMKQIADDLKRSEMLVSLAELESIREEIVKKFEESMGQTQSRIDLIIKELKIEEPAKPAEEEKPKMPMPQRKARRPVPKVKSEGEESEEPAEEPVEGAEGEEKQPAGKGDVESRLEQLKKEVLKELDELDKLELEN